MNILFSKKKGDPSLGIEFVWSMALEAKSPMSITESIIPELFFDYFFIKAGSIKCVDKKQDGEYKLPQQTLKNIYTRPLTLHLSTPLRLFGVRFSLKFAELFWEENIRANSFSTQNWVGENTKDLASFETQIKRYLRKRQVKKTPYPMLLPSIQESSWLVNFSDRHKRRLYKTIFGLSRKELQNIRNVHLFLEQVCDFASENPRIIQHVTPNVFYDQPHLNHSFKKMTGFSPVEYFEAGSILQDNLMSASYNADSER